MAMNVAECQQMTAAAEANGVDLTIAYYRRAFPAVLKIKQLIDQNSIGRPLTSRVELATRYQPSK